ncbi:MAG: hypothetical protein B6D61_13900 [Bacteroidetes bacterium 4484_249]|nr:MAG: hypothetical protein B6D61_13900 [Bacteroidetes bacterium 4484_249]
MQYSTKEIINELLIAEEELETYIFSQDIKVSKEGKVDKKAYQTILSFYENKPINGKLKIKEVAENNLVYKSNDSKVLIYQDDVISFLKKLPNNSIDLIVTDPAYSGMNQRLQLGRGKIIGKYKDKGENGKWFEEFHDTEENYNIFLNECYRVLKNNRHIYIMFDSYSMLSLAPLIRKVFNVKNILCWDKAHIGLGHYFRRRHEFIIFSSKGKRKLNSKSIPDVWKIKRISPMKYPTQKPTELFELMITGSADKDYLICDPFLGSGSAAIASIKKGCRFIGCDISETAVEVSSDRISKYLSTKEDPIQKNSLLADDESLNKLFLNGKFK